jgi:hypothetical protein
MMVRAIELTDLLAKTTAAEKVTQIEKSSPDLAQRQFALELEEKKAERRQKSIPTSKTDEAIIHREQHSKDKEGQQKKKKKEQEKKKKVPMSIDIKA